MEKDDVKELLEAILKALVSEPEKVKVTKTVDEMGVLLSVQLGEEDAGLVIGRQGKTIQAIRIVIGAIGMRTRARVNIKLDVPERPSRNSSETQNPGGKDSGLNLEL